MSRVLEVSPEQFERMVEAIDRQKQARADEMPTERDALLVMQRAYERLKELGWSDAVYCPKDGTIFDSIEAGSIGIHDCQYIGRWPNGFWQVFEAGDIWPSRPTLYRLKNTPTQPPEGQPDAHPHREQGQDAGGDDGHV